MYKFLCGKCTNTHNIYYSQKGMKHFGLEILIVYRILGHLQL